MKEVLKSTVSLSPLQTRVDPLWPWLNLHPSGMYPSSFQGKLLEVIWHQRAALVQGWSQHLRFRSCCSFSARNVAQEVGVCPCEGPQYVLEDCASAKQSLLIVFQCYFSVCLPDLLHCGIRRESCVLLAHLLHFFSDTESWFCRFSTIYVFQDSLQAPN